MGRDHLSAGCLALIVALACTAFCLADDMDVRRDQMLQAMIRSPYPAAGLWHYEDLALAAYYLGQNEKGDQAILDDQVEFAKDDKMEGFHWHAFMLERIYFLFGGQSKHFPGRMSAQAEKALVDMLWRWAGPNGRLEMTLPERDWWVWGSENHHMQAWGSFWGAAHIFAERPEFKDRKYSDGTAPAEMAKAFDEYFKRWTRNRAGCGLLVECNSGYNKYTLGPVYNLADFAQDPVLRNRAKMFLDLFWADWAVEQIDGMRGGSRHRCYPGRDALEHGSVRPEAWYHFGIGDPRSKHPSGMCAATSFYRPPSLVTELASDTPARGVYAYVSRRPGLALPQPAGGPVPNLASDAHNLFYIEKGVYTLDSGCGDLLRYTWCTPDFVMGTSMVKALPQKAWTNISSQNRWEGVIFAGHPTARIFTAPLTPEKGSVYNAHWSVQNKGVLIVQRLKASNAKGQRVWFDEALPRVEKDGWVFAQAPQAYAAVRVVQGETAWEADAPEQHHEKTSRAGKGMWLACKDEFSPVILEVARKSDCGDFEAFQKAVLGSALSWEDGKCQYASALHKTTLTLWADYSQPPQVDGQTVKYDAPKAYDGPFIRGDFGSGVVTIQKGGQKLVLDFTK